VTTRFLIVRVEGGETVPLRIWRTPHGVDAFLSHQRPGRYRVYEVHDGVVQETYTETTK